MSETQTEKKTDLKIVETEPSVASILGGNKRDQEESMTKAEGDVEESNRVALRDAVSLLNNLGEENSQQVYEGFEALFSDPLIQDYMSNNAKAAFYDCSHHGIGIHHVIVCGMDGEYQARALKLLLEQPFMTQVFEQFPRRATEKLFQIIRNLPSQDVVDAASLLYEQPYFQKALAQDFSDFPEQLSAYVQEVRERTDLDLYSELVKATLTVVRERGTKELTDITENLSPAQKAEGSLVVAFAYAVSNEGSGRTPRLNNPKITKLFQDVVGKEWGVYPFYGQEKTMMRRDYGAGYLSSGSGSVSHRSALPFLRVVKPVNAEEDIHAVISVETGDGNLKVTDPVVTLERRLG